METAKEELQAANEELTTLNEELQNRNAELLEVNEKLASSEERFRLLVTGVKDYAIFLLDPQGRVATWNEGARRFKGYEANEIIGKHFSVFYPKKAIGDHYPEMELKVATERGHYEDEGWRIRKDGSSFWANVVITRINDTHGNLLGFSKVTRDLTERKKMEDELRKSRDQLEYRVEQRTKELSAALGARDEFLSIASHELKTPLTALKLQLQMSQRNLSRPGSQIPTREQLIESYAFAVKQTNSLAELVEDLLDTSRIKTGNFSLGLGEMDLSELTKDVLRRFSAQLKSTGGIAELSADDPVMGHWDRHRLEQVIVNLLSNAIKYAPGAKIHIAVTASNDKAFLTVQDFGPGIPKSLQSKIFERFERIRADKNVGGLGLGLFIVRKIVEAHHGKIDLESEEGQGAKFVVELPLNPKSSEVRATDTAKS
jgi:PAS domain S-box-containing protein